MLPAASAATTAFRPVQPLEQASQQWSSPAPAAETARASAGEKAAANLRTETHHAVKAAEQTPVAARLRDQEKAETTDRSADAPTGPPPAFEESPLERQARVAFDPPEPDAQGKTLPEDELTALPPEGRDVERVTPEPPPSRTERAETSFAETRSLSAGKEPATVDLEV